MTPTPNIIPRKSPASSTVRRNTRKPAVPSKRRDMTGSEQRTIVEAKLHYPEWYQGRHARAYSKAVEAKLKEIKNAHRKLTYTAAYNRGSGQYTLMLRYKNAKNTPVTVQVGKSEAHPIKFTTSPYTRVPDHGRVAPYELETFTGVLDKISLAPRTEITVLDTPYTTTRSVEETLTNAHYRIALKLNPQSGATRRAVHVKKKHKATNRQS